MDPESPEIYDDLDFVVGPLPDDTDYLMSGALPAGSAIPRVDAPNLWLWYVGIANQARRREQALRELPFYPNPDAACKTSGGESPRAGSSSGWSSVQPMSLDVRSGKQHQHSGTGSSNQAALSTPATDETDPNFPTFIVKGGFEPPPSRPVVKDIEDAFTERKSVFPHSHGAKTDVKETERILKEEAEEYSNRKSRRRKSGTPIQNPQNRARPPRMPPGTDDTLTERVKKEIMRQRILDGDGRKPDMGFDLDAADEKIIREHAYKMKKAMAVASGGGKDNTRRNSKHKRGKSSEDKVMFKSKGKAKTIVTEPENERPPLEEGDLDFPKREIAQPVLATVIPDRSAFKDLDHRRDLISQGAKVPVPMASTDGPASDGPAVSQLPVPPVPNPSLVTQAAAGVQRLGLRLEHDAEPQEEAQYLLDENVDEEYEDVEDDEEEGDAGEEDGGVRVDS